jgi:pyruvate dehydrogenase E1 component alpha subunit
LAENPLLPHSQLRALYASMVETRVLERRAKAAAGAREALLAATTIHLRPGDLVCGAAGDGTPHKLAPVGKNPKLAGVLDAPSGDRLAICAAAARGLQASAAPGETGLVLAFAQTGVAEPSWEAALTWAQQAELPLLLAVADFSGGKASRAGGKAMDWAAISRLSRRTKLPVISVDGEDAVAIYRVMQECVLRARLGLGPAVVWAVMSPGTLAGAALPVARLRRYMRVRGIAVG